MLDMFGAFFFSAIAVRTIQTSMTPSNRTETELLSRNLLKACLVAGILLSVIYTGFMLAAYSHAAMMQRFNPPQIIYQLSRIVLGGYGAVFVGICVTFACLATAIALADVSSNYLHQHLPAERRFRSKTPELQGQVVRGPLFMVFPVSTIYRACNIGGRSQYSPY